MGEAANAIDADDKRENRTGSPEQKTAGGSTSTTDTGTGTGTGSGTGRGTAGITIIEEEKLPRVADGLGVPRVQGKRKRPEAPKGSRSVKAAEKAAEAEKSQATTEAAKMISALVKTVFDITSIRAGAHWALSQKEADAIATPAANIMGRYDLTEKMGEYGDWFGLTMALGAAAVPRVLIQLSTNKPQKEVKNNVQPIRKPEQPQSAITNASESNRESGIPNGKSALDGHSPIKQLLTASMGESF